MKPLASLRRMMITHIQKNLRHMQFQKPSKICQKTTSLLQKEKLLLRFMSRMHKSCLGYSSRLSNSLLNNWCRGYINWICQWFSATFRIKIWFYIWWQPHIITKQVRPSILNQPLQSQVQKKLLPKESQSHHQLWTKRKKRNVKKENASQNSNN